MIHGLPARFAAGLLVATGWGAAAPGFAAPAAQADKPAAAAQKSPQAENPDSETEVSEVVVTARKPPPAPGAVVGDIKPELQLGPSDIQSYGVSTVTELIDELAPETRSDRGRGGESPVILLNGRRISGFNEIQNIPTEAILRVDILPEEVALKYGYTADQRVVNIVLRRRFRAVTAELQGGGATEGGQESGEAELDLFHVRGDNRLNLDLKYQGASELTDAARGVVEPAPSSPDALGFDAAVLGRSRTLSPATQSLTGNAVLARPLIAGVNATFNLTLAANSSASLQGLPSVALSVPAVDPFLPAAAPPGAPVLVDREIDSLGPLHQTTQGWGAHLGSALNRDLGHWRLSLTDAYDHGDSRTQTDTGVNAAPLQALLDAGSESFDPFATPPSGLILALPRGDARTTTDGANIQLLANGPLLKLPAGPIYVSAKTGDTQSWLASSSTRPAEGLGEDRTVDLTRNDANAQLSIDLPLASRENKVFSVIGDLSINLNAAMDQLSDYGGLRAFGYGVNWTPIPGYNLIVSHTNDQAAPSIQQLGGPVVQTPGVRVFDYATGQTVDVTQISGGNRALGADNRNVFKIGLTLKPFSGQDFTLTANYIASDVDHGVQTFPAAYAAIESAFPGRFIRDASGELIEEDVRPVEFAKSQRSEIRWGLNYARSIGPQPPPRTPRREAGADEQRPRPSGQARGEGRGDGRGGGGGGGGGPGGRGGFGRGGLNPGGGRLQLAVYHTVYFVDRLLATPGGPTLDLLNGAAASSTGGQYRNEVEAEAGMTLLGFGARLSADWRQASFVRGGAESSTGDLFFSDIATVNLRLFDNLGQQPWLVKRMAWLRGARVTLNINNLFDQRISVHDAAGATPLSYQPAYLDPIGRSVRLGVRKLFF